MKIILVSIGTRGDMEPFLAIGELLAENGHQVICAFPEQFRDLVADANLAFASLGSKYVAMLEGQEGRAAMGGRGSGLTRLLAQIKLASRQTEANRELVHRQYRIIEDETPDRVVHNSLASYPVIWGVTHPRRHVQVSAVPYLHYVRGHSHLAFGRDLGPPLNRLTYSVANFGTVVTTLIAKRWLDIPVKITPRQVGEALRSARTIYTISPTLFPRPEAWGDHLQVLGYHARKRTVEWEPDEGLTRFLGQHDRPLLITFGSMSNPAPEEKTGLIIDILQRVNLAAIINTASGGLVKPDGFDSDHIHFVTRIPYDWILPRTYAAIHHGGSGTTHLALRHGCATMIIPHIIDQFVWNDLVSKLGAGPKGIKIGALATASLEPRILDLVNRCAYKRNAEQIAGRMAREDFREELVQSIVQG
jgi:UDP:flavonoid glycosyltransferase YjiC (YdhE family)